MCREGGNSAAFDVKKTVLVLSQREFKNVISVLSDPSLICENSDDTIWPTCFIGSNEKMFWGGAVIWSPGGIPEPHVLEEMHIHLPTCISLCKYSRDLQQIQCKKKKSDSCF